MGLYALSMVSTCGLFADARQSSSIGNKFLILEALPTRASSLTLLQLPQLAIAGLMIAIATCWHHYAPASAVTLWGCCAWAIATSHFFPVRRWLRVPVWLLIAAVAPIVSLIAYGPGNSPPSWTRAAIASLMWAALGLALSPRWPRRAVVRATSEIVPVLMTPTARSEAPPPFRPSNAGVGFRQLFPFAVPQQRMWVLWPLAIFQLIMALMIVASTPGASATLGWLMLPNFVGPAIAAIISRPSLDFLASRPLRLRYILSRTVLPWFLYALLLPLAIFLRELAHTPRSHEASARAALTVFSCLFLYGVEPARVAGVARRSLAMVAAWSPPGLIFVTMLSTPPFRLFPAPPLWSLATIAIASGIVWYSPGPWRRLPMTS